MKQIGILGAGAWGTAIAQVLAKNGNKVVLWAMEKEVVETINTRHENSLFLKGIQLHENITASQSIEEVAQDKEYLILASPSLYLASTVKKIAHLESLQKGTTCIGVLTKGFIPSDTGPKLIVETLESVLPAVYQKSVVYISGPSHAEEVATGKLTGLIAASESPKNAIRFRELLKSESLMVFSSLDVIGVQICAAAKNAVAVVFGCLDAVTESSDFFGDNTESLLLAAGLNEIQTLGFAMGATHAETFTSIAGVGDLDVTCRSPYGRNRKFGREIILNNSLKDFKNLNDIIDNIDKIGYLPEGLVACKYIQEISEAKNLRLPICNGLYKILNKEIEPIDFLKEVLF